MKPLSPLVALSFVLALTAATAPTVSHSSPDPVLATVFRAQLSEARLGIRMEIRADLERRSQEYFSASELKAPELLRLAESRLAGH